MLLGRGGFRDEPWLPNGAARIQRRLVVPAHHFCDRADRCDRSPGPVPGARIFGDMRFNMTGVLRFGVGRVTNSSFPRNLGVINAAHENHRPCPDPAAEPAA
jgi:hypothetical protein